MSPIVRETLERVVVALWFAGILLLLYLTLRSQLARGNEPEAEWDLVALCGGTVDVGMAYGGDGSPDVYGYMPDTDDSKARDVTRPRATAAAPLHLRPAP
jgi:hypothetical protein